MVTPGSNESMSETTPVESVHMITTIDKSMLAKAQGTMMDRIN